MNETPVLREIFLDAGRVYRETVRLFRNNVGQAWQGKKISISGGRLVLDKAHPVRFGLFRGSSDLIGWKSVVVTPDMIGKRVAIFVSIETKKPKGEAEEHQETWLEQVKKAGGLAGVATSPEEARKIIGE